MIILVLVKKQNFIIITQKMVDTALYICITYTDRFNEVDLAISMFLLVIKILILPEAQAQIRFKLLFQLRFILEHSKKVQFISVVGAVTLLIAS